MFSATTADVKSYFPLPSCCFASFVSIPAANYCHGRASVDYFVARNRRQNIRLHFSSSYHYCPLRRREAFIFVTFITAASLFVTAVIMMDAVDEVAFLILDRYKM